MDKKNIDNKDIQKMIALQKEAALQDFETIDFQQRLENRLALETKKANLTQVATLISRPVYKYTLGAAAAVLVIITSIYIGVTYFAGGLEKQDLVNMFARHPVFQQKIPDASIMEDSLTEEEKLRLELQWKVDERIYSSYSKTLDTGVLAARLQQLFDAGEMPGDEPGETGTLVPETLKGPPGDPYNLEIRLQKIKNQNKVQLFFEKFKKNKKEA